MKRSRSVGPPAGLPALLFAVAAAGLASPAPRPEELLQTKAELLAAADGRSGSIRLEERITPGWHVNSHHPSEDYLIATEAKLDAAAGVTAGKASYPEGKLKKFSFSDKPLSVYEDQFTIEIPISWTGSAPARMTGLIEFQACNDTQCLPPATVRFEVSAAPAPTAGALAGGAIPLSQAPAGPAAKPSVPGAAQDFAELLERRGLAVALLIVFGWGLALNLTPCVYPVIPLTIGFFGGQAADNKRRVFGLAAVYVLGMATMYSALGVAAALSGRLFGVALQSPWVLAGVALVLVLLALSMFGFYEIRMPTAWTQKAGARAGAAGAYGMGLLVGVVAAPCIGPVVLALLAFVAARGEAAFGFLIFFVLSLGLGLPYLFLGAFSGSISRLPRAGEWMEGVKKIFGWLLIAMAAYFLRTVLPPPFGSWLLPAVLVVGALTLAIGTTALRRGARLSAAVAFLAAALFFMPHRPTPSATPGWQAYSAGEVAHAGRSTVIDFSADWCLPCRELDEKTFTDPRVRQALSRRLLFKADMTKTASPEAVALSEKYGIFGVPTIIFLDASGQERQELRLVGFEGPEKFLERLAKAP